MSSFDTSMMNTYLITAFALAATAVVLSLGVAAHEVAHHRRLRRPQPGTRTRGERALPVVDLRGGGDERVVPARSLERCRS
jgi:hypothetical protein